MARCCYVVILIKSWRAGTSFQSPLSSQKRWKYLSYSTLVFDQMSLLLYLGFKVNKHKCNFNYVAMPMVMSQILKSVDLKKTKIQTSQEWNNIFSSNKKSSLITYQGLCYSKKKFVFHISLIFSEVGDSSVESAGNPYKVDQMINR